MPKIQYINHTFRRESQQRIDDVNDIIAEYAASGYILTLRQAYYQLVARGLLGNSQKNYKTLGNVVCKAREAGLIDWNAIEDRTRNLQANPQPDYFR